MSARRSSSEKKPKINSKYDSPLFKYYCVVRQSDDCHFNFLIFSFASNSKNVKKKIATTNPTNSKCLLSIPNEKEKPGRLVSFGHLFPLLFQSKKIKIELP